MAGRAFWILTGTAENWETAINGNVWGVREGRQKQNLSQEQLAEKAGLHRTYIGMVERAEKNITLENIEKIAKALQTSLDKLMSLEK